jgi:hypothetical protein
VEKCWLFAVSYPESVPRGFLEKNCRIRQAACMNLTNSLHCWPVAEKLKPLPHRRPMMIRSGGILYKYGGCGVYPVKAWTAIFKKIAASWQIIL